MIYDYLKLMNSGYNLFSVYAPISPCLFSKSK